MVTRAHDEKSKQVRRNDILQAARKLFLSEKFSCRVLPRTAFSGNAQDHG